MVKSNNRYVLKVEKTLKKEKENRWCEKFTRTILKRRE